MAKNIGMIQGSGGGSSSTDPQVDAVITAARLESDDNLVIERSKGASVNVNLSALRHIRLVSPTLVEGNDITFSINPHSNAYSDSDMYEFRATATNTGTVRARVRYSSGGSIFNLAYKDVLDIHGLPLVAGAMQQGELIRIRFDTDLDKWISNIYPLADATHPGLLSPKYFEYLSNAVQSYTVLPAPADHENLQVVLVNGKLYQNHSTPAANVLSGIIGEIGDGVSKGIRLSDGPYAALGRWTSNPNHVVEWIAVTNGDLLTIAIERRAYRTAKGSNEAANDQLTLEATTGGVTTTATVSLLSTDSIYTDEDGTVYLTFEGSVTSSFGINAADAGDAVTFLIKRNNSDFITHAADLPHWVRYPLDTEQHQVSSLFGKVATFDELPDASEYRNGQIALVEGLFYKNYNVPEANTFQGVVGAISASNETFKGAHAPDGMFNPFGEWTSNPHHTISWLNSGDQGDFVVTLRQSEYRRANGGTTEAAGDTLTVDITVGNTTETVLVTYNPAYTSLVTSDGKVYIAFTATVGNNFVLNQANAGDIFKVVFKRNNVAFFTFPENQPHWNLYNHILETPERDLRTVLVFETLPSADRYINGQTILVDGKLYRRFATSTENVFGGTVGSTDFGGVVSKGINDGNISGTNPHGQWTSDPDAFLAWIESDADGHFFALIRQNLYRAGKGSSEANGDTLTFDITIDGTTQTATGRYTGVTTTASDGKVYLNFYGTVAADFVLNGADTGDTMDVVIKRNNTVFVTHPENLPHWVLYNIDTDALGIRDTIGVSDDLPDASEYQNGQIFIVGNRLYRKTRTAIQDTVTFESGVYKGKYGVSVGGGLYDTFGQFTSNPRRAVFDLESDTDGNLDFTMRRDVYRELKGSNEVSGDTLTLEITPEGGTTQTIDVDYVSRNFHSLGIDYVVFIKNVTGGLNIVDEDVGTTFNLVVKRNGVIFLAHTVGEPHWVHFNIDTGRNTIPTADDILVDARGFDGNLGTADTTVQKVAQKLDDLVIGSRNGGLTAEQVRHIVAAFLTEGTNITLVHDDNANTLAISSSGGTTLTDEELQDKIAAFLQGGSNLTLDYDDNANTLTLNASGTGGESAHLAYVELNALVNFGFSDTARAESSGGVFFGQTRTGLGQLVAYSDIHNKLYRWPVPSTGGTLWLGDLGGLSDTVRSNINGSHLFIANSGTAAVEIMIGGVGSVFPANATLEPGGVVELLLYANPSGTQFADGKEFNLIVTPHDEIEPRTYFGSNVPNTNFGNVDDLYFRRVSATTTTLYEKESSGWELRQTISSGAFTVGANFPSSPATHAAHLFTTNKSGLSGVVDTDGATSKTTANRLDLFQYNGTNWQYVGYLGAAVRENDIPIFDTLPDAGDYQNKVVLVAGRFWRGTNTPAANTYAGITAQTTNRNGRIFRGTDAGFINEPLGRWTSNPNGTVAWFHAESSGGIAIGIRRDHYRTAKGSNEATNDQIVVSITIGGTTQTATLTYSGVPITNRQGDTYIAFNGTIDTSTFLLYTSNAGTAFSLRILRNNSDLFTHAADLAHWVVYPLWAEQVIGSEVVLSSDVRSVRKTTQTAYDALTTKDANTLYAIVG